jgi:hypothetical protein
MARRFKCREDFYHIQHDPSKSIDIYIHAIETGRQNLISLGCTIDDSQTLDLLLMNLHPSYHTIRTSILTAKSEPSLSDVKGILIGSASSAIEIKSEPIDFAFAVRSKHGNIQKKKSGQFPRSGTTPPPTLEDDKGFRWCDPTNENHCHRCGRQNHIAAFCVYNMPREVREWIITGPPKPRYFPPTSTNTAHQTEQVLSSTTFDHYSPRPSSPSSCSSSPGHILLLT